MDGDELSLAHYVYVIGTMVDGRLSAPVKVGVTTDVSGRLATLQTGSSRPLGLLYALGLPNRLLALGLERTFHLAQAERRLAGEWFDLSPLRAMKLLLLLFVLSRGHPQSVEETHWQALGVAIDEEFEMRAAALLDQA